MNDPCTKIVSLPRDIAVRESSNRTLRGYHFNHPLWHYFDSSHPKILTQSRMETTEPAPERNAKRTRAEMEGGNNEHNGSEAVHGDDSKTRWNEY